MDEDTDALTSSLSMWDVDIGLLIKLVKNFPYLYNTNFEEFKNIPLKERTWTKISSTLKVPAIDCRRLWKNLRDKFGKERRIHCKHPEIRPQWEFYDQMKFLQPFVRRRRRQKKTQTVRASEWLKSLKKGESEENDDKNHADIVHKMSWDGDPIGIDIPSDNISFLDESDVDANQATEEITVAMVDDLPINQVGQGNSVSIVRYQSSEEAFGAYVASRLMDFPLEDRQAKKVKIFKALEDLDAEIS